MNSMLYMAMAVICSTLVSMIIRLSEKKIRNNMGMFLGNYIVCCVLSLLFMERRTFAFAEPGLGVTAAMGLLSGVLYLLCFVLLQYSIQKNGVILSTTYMKLGVLIPTLLAILVFHEQPRAVQICGIILALVAIVMMYYERENAQAAKYQILLIVLLAASGLTDSMANIFDKLGNAALKDQYLLFTFGAAALCSLVLFLKKRQALCGWDVLFGICLGLPNYFSSRFLLQALHRLPAVVVYPVCSVGTIVALCILGRVIFGERLSRKKVIAIAIIIGALILLNL